MLRTTSGGRNECRFVDKARNENVVAEQVLIVRLPDWARGRGRKGRHDPWPILPTLHTEDGFALATNPSSHARTW